MKKRITFERWLFIFDWPMQKNSILLFQHFLNDFILISFVSRMNIWERKLALVLNRRRSIFSFSFSYTSLSKILDQFSASFDLRNEKRNKSILASLIFLLHLAKSLPFSEAEGNFSNVFIQMRLFTRLTKKKKISSFNFDGQLLIFFIRKSFPIGFVCSSMRKILFFCLFTIPESIEDYRIFTLLKVRL